MTITNGYATRDDIKNALRIPLSDTQDDDLIDVAVEAASREIDGYCERVFYSTSGTRVYIPQSSFLVETDDISTLTTLKTSPDGEEFSVTWAESDRQLEPLNGIAGGLTTPFTRIRAIDIPPKNPMLLTGKQTANPPIENTLFHPYIV